LHYHHRLRLFFFLSLKLELVFHLPLCWLFSFASRLLLLSTC
jgi:hypothetical protein